MCHSSIRPATDRIPIEPIAMQRTTSEAIITRRRSKRSLTTPPMSRKTTMGRLHATPTTDIAVGTFDSS
ncbi:hypothetical protein BH24ACT26_BH24ACT26_23500 [soil metagenome]